MLGEVLESLAGDGEERREELGVAVPMATGGAARGRRRGPAHASNWVSHFIGTCPSQRCNGRDEGSGRHIEARTSACR
jgi:hypothetical protein